MEMLYLLFPVIFIAVAPSMNEPLNLVRFLIIGVWVITYCLVNPPRFHLRDKLIALFGLIFCSYAVSALVNKQNPMLALIGGYNRNLGLLTFIFAFLLMVLAANNKLNFSKYLALGLWPMIAISLIIGFLQIFHLDPFMWAEEDRVVLFFGNSNFAGSALGTLLLIPTFYLVSKKQKNPRIFSACLIILIFILGYFTRTLQFYAIAIPSLFVFLLISYQETINKFGKKVKIIGSFFGLLSLISALIMFWNQFIVNSNFSDRINSSIIGVRIFRDHPIFGVGIEEFWRYQGQYKTIAQQRSISPNYIIDKSHNVFIDYFANGGFITGGLFLIFVIFSIVKIIKISRIQNMRQDKLETAFLSAVWIGYVVQLFFATDSLFVMTFAFFNLGLLIGKSRKEIKVKVNSNKTALLAIRVSYFIALILFVWLSTSAVRSDLNVKAVITNQMLNGNLILDSVKKFPNPKGTEAIIVHALKDSENCPFVNAASQELISIDDRSSQGWYFKALCSDNVGDQVSALKFVEQALKFQPINTIYLEAKFRLECRLKKSVEAESTLQRMIEVNPNLQTLSELNQLLEKAKLTL